MHELEDLEQFIRVLPEPCFLVSGSGEILKANSAAEQLSGAERNALGGTQFSSLVTDAPEKVASFLRLCSRSRELAPGAVTWRVGGGKTLDVRCDGAVLHVKTATSPAVLFVRCRPKAEATEQFVLLNQKIVALSKEILERKKVEQQRDELLQSERAARLEAERVSRMKDEFLATLSHELRTPLNSILGYAQLLCETEQLNEETLRGLDVIQRNARIQARLIEDLVDMSRIISGKIRLEVQRVELVSVVEAAMDAIRPAADARSIRLHATLDPLAGSVKGDPARLQQVVWNLLSNAVKFTPKGGRVQVFLERVNSHIEITVSDTGIGIRPEFLPHVFDRFQQADSSTTRRHAGLGLGLSIVRQLVELHGGTVRAKSPGEGQGATFSICLPLLVLYDELLPEEKPSRPPAQPCSERARLPSLAGVTILVVDDEPDARELVKRILAQCGAGVLTAESAVEALTILPGQAVHLVVSDIGMPEQDGYWLMQEIRKLGPEQGGRTPAIALTAFARSTDRTRAMLVGYNVHLSKPVEPTELIATVASLAGRTGGV